jgi:hypothetical protein
VSFISRVSLFIFCLDDICIGNRRVLKCPTTTVLESVYAFKSFSVCLMKLDALTLSRCTLIFFVSS